MRKIIRLLVLLVATMLCIPAWPQAGAPPISLHFNPGVLFPIGESETYFRVGPAAGLSARFRMPGGLSFLFAKAGLEYGYTSIVGATESLSMLGIEAGGGAALDLGALSLSAEVPGGYNAALMHGVAGVPPGGGAVVSASIGADYFLTPVFSLGISGTFRYLPGLYLGAGAAIGATYDLDGIRRRGALLRAPAARPQALPMEGVKGKGEGLQIQNISWGTIFPVFHAYYDDHPIGTASLANLEKDPITDITLTLQVKQYMDSPKECAVPASLAAGESRAVELNALFTNRILEITEGTKASVELALRYKLKGNWFQDTKVATIEVLNRNSMTWEDDNRAAAFVTSLDPTIQTVANNIVNITKSSRSKALDANLLSAMAVYEAMRLYGISYQVDPTSAYTDFASKKNAIDYLKFPRQVLEHRAGDCDDLTILFSALLQSISIPTAFVTVPGHIYLAFALDTAVNVVRSTYNRAGELIFDREKAWVPLELTERNAGFLRAWESGAKQWRQFSARDQARLLPVEEAWKLYKPVQLPGTGTPVVLPQEDKLAREFSAEMVRYIDTEILDQVATIQGEIKKSGETPKLVTRLGLLYARFGLYDRAEREFAKVEKSNYVPALVNLGNIYLLRNDPEKALTYYTRATLVDPENATALLGLAQANHTLENYGASTKSFARVKELSPEMASRYAYLDFRGEEASRAADMSNMRGVMEWADEK